MSRSTERSVRPSSHTTRSDETMKGAAESHPETRIPGAPGDAARAGGMKAPLLHQHLSVFVRFSSVFIGGSKIYDLFCELSALSPVKRLFRAPGEPKKP